MRTRGSSWSNKPAGMVVHPARGHWSGTLTAALAYRFASLSDVGGPSRPGIVHRLDRDTSGVIVVAKNNAVHLHLSTQFHDRLVAKEYLAIAAGRLDRDRDWIDAGDRQAPLPARKMAVRPGHETAKAAQTFYEVTGGSAASRWSRCVPKPGAPIKSAFTWLTSVAPSFATGCTAATDRSPPPI